MISFGRDSVRSAHRVRVDRLLRASLCWVAGIFLCLLAFPLPVEAATYLDPMETAAADEVRVLQNLSPVVFSSSGTWSSLYDKSFLSFSNPTKPIGRVTYKVRGCQRIVVGIYTHTGSFVHRVGGQKVLGFESEDVDRNQRPADAEQALYSIANQAAYTRMDGSPWQAVYDSFYTFADPAALGESAASGDLAAYGVNVYVSTDDKAFTRLNLTFESLDYKAGKSYCYEEFSGVVPPTAQAVMVEINDFHRYYDMTSRSWQTKSSRRMTALASVTLTGHAMETGDPPPLPPSSSLPEESSAEEVSSSSDKSNSSDKSDSSDMSSSSDKSSSSGKSSSSPKSSSSTKSSSSKKSSSSRKSDEEEEEEKSPSSKFEGVIVARQGTLPAAAPPAAAAPAATSSSRITSVSSSQQSSRKSESSSRKESSASSEPSNSSASSEEESPSSTQLSPVAAQEPALPEEREIIYYQSPATGKEDDAFSIGVGGYIAVVCGVILFLLLRSRKK
jgi:hypothetical protein